MGGGPLIVISGRLAASQAHHCEKHRLCFCYYRYHYHYHYYFPLNYTFAMAAARIIKDDQLLRKDRYKRAGTPSIRLPSSSPR